MSNIHFPITKTSVSIQFDEATRNLETTTSIVYPQTLTVKQTTWKQAKYLKSLCMKPLQKALS